MDPERWERLQEIFHAALELPRCDRASFVSQKCAGEPDAVADVMSLIQAHECDGPLADLADAAAQDSPSVEWIGPYRILGLLGQGGMSTVYLAEREGVGFKQRVALKLLRAGFADRQLTDRVVGESRILARLEHPGIARLIDGGATPVGQPYFAMELVEGAHLTDFCERNQASLSQRLRIFVAVCEAVHFAHQQLVVHRDLKPSNILVSAAGHPKLLDFGIAKLLDPSRGVEGATVTVPCFTPAYASPEQVRRGQVGTASDVYSLGVILYELLTGSLPYATDNASPAAVQRVVCDTIRERPSARATQSRMRRLLTGDLDTIVMKALAKEPTRRYESVAQLADDVRRYLDGRPVLARPDSFAYRVSKFVGRHRSGVAAATLVAASLATGVITAGWQARRAAKQQERAAEEAAKADLVTDLMVELFRLSDPTATPGDTLTARELLDHGVERIELEFGRQLDVQAKVFAEVARVYGHLGVLPRAEQLAHRALRLRNDLYGPASLEVSESMDQLGELHATQGNADSAIADYRRAVEIREARLTAPDSLLAHIQSELGWLLRAAGEHEAAAETFTRALDTQRRLHGGEGPEVAATLFGLAATFHDRGRFDEAERMFQAALADYDSARGKPHPMVATALLNIGMIRRLREQYRSAEPLLRSAVSMRSALYDPNHPDVIEATSQWGIELAELGRYGEAARVLTDGLHRADRTLGYAHPFASTMREELAILLTATGRYDEAMAHFDTSLAAKRARHRGDHVQLLYALIRSARPLIEAGRLRQADDRLEEARAMAAQLSPGSRDVSDMLILHGQAQIEFRRGRLAEAGRFLAEAQAIARDRLRDNHRYSLALMRDEAALLLERDRPEDAAALLERVLAGERSVRPEPHPRVGSTLRLLGAALVARGEVTRAEPVLRDALFQLKELPASQWEVGTVQCLLGAALAQQGRLDEARPLLTEGLRTVRRHFGPESREARRAGQQVAGLMAQAGA